MQNIILLLLCLAIGIALRGFGRVPDNAHTTLNTFIIYVAFPALILVQVHGLHLEPALLFPVSMPWLLFIIGAGVFWIIARCLKLPPTTTGALMLTGGLGNTSFIGLPMIEALYGKSGIATGILIDTLGTYLVLSTLGVTIACIYSRGTTTARGLMKRVVTFPPLIAVIAAMALMDVSYPTWLHDVLARLGGTLAPLALVSVGLQLRLDALRGNRTPLALGLSYKLIAAPALLGVLYFGLLGLNDDNMRVTVLESAMGPQIGGAIVASQYGLNPALVTLMVGAGTILAFMTAPCCWHLLSFATGPLSV
ncbi:MAG TPA: AEC family transporter [Acetobacteraceae bacterium]|jgi:predicted permease|nr:AEC family transporter [Acetobacteraceae bacterium]